MREITLEELLEAGCHFGHQVTRQNPKARDFVFEARDNIHIIDLAKTKEGLEEAASFVKDLASKQGSTLLVVGTKRQAQDLVKEEIKRVSAEGVDAPFFVTNRWIGGILTNFSEVSKNFKKLKDISDNLQDKQIKAKYTKKEIGLWEKERQKLESLYGGVTALTKSPDALFIIDTHLEDLAVREAKRMGVATVGITDTNSDPSLVNYPIPANDDAVGSIKLILSYIIDAWIEGRKESQNVILSETKDLTDVRDSSATPQNDNTEKVSKVSEVSEGEEPKKVRKTKMKESTEKEEKDGRRKPRASKKVA